MNMRIVFRERSDDLAGAVARVIVDHDDARVRNGIALGNEAPQAAADIGFLVPGWNDDDDGVTLVIVNLVRLQAIELSSLANRPRNQPSDDQKPNTG